MSSTAIIFAKELTRWENFPGDVPPESKSVWNALSHATQEELKADLAKQGFFSGTSFSFIGIDLQGCRKDIFTVQCSV